MLKTKYIPVAIDQAYQRRQKDTEGDFFRKIAAQTTRKSETKQGLYFVSPDGKLLGFTNNRASGRVRRVFDTVDAAEIDATSPIETSKVDKRYNPQPPKGGLVVRVNAKVLGGYEKAADDSRKIFQTSLSRDNLWVTAEEHQSLVKGEVADQLLQRLARFHLVDNTRGEPPMWEKDEVIACTLAIANGRLSGSAHMQTKDGSREYKCDLLGEIEVKDDKVIRLDIVAKGLFLGEGPYTRRAPKGKFPLAIAFRLADMKDVADPIPPQGSRGWVDGYMQPR